MPIDHKQSFDFNDPTAALRADCSKAVEILTRMTRDTATKGNDILPLDYLKRCKGLSFVVTRAGGLGVSVSRGRAFTIQKLNVVNGKQQWSGPCWVNLTDLGLGLTAGYNEIVTVVVLGNQNAVDKVKKSEPTMNLDGSIILGKNSAVTATLEQEGIASIPFSLADGAYVDLSVKGGAAILHKKKNQAVYGSGITAEAILDGKVPAPPEFQSLYDLLNELCAKPTSPDE